MGSGAPRHRLGLQSVQCTMSGWVHHKMCCAAVACPAWGCPGEGRVGAGSEPLDTGWTCRSKNCQLREAMTERLCCPLLPTAAHSDKSRHGVAEKKGLRR